MILNTTWLWAAALVSAVSWGIHTFVGGGQIVPALFGSDLKKMPKYVLFFVWHIATITIAAIAIGYGLCAVVFLLVGMYVKKNPEIGEAGH